MALTLEQFKELRNKGLNTEQIVKFEGGFKPPGTDQSFLAKEPSGKSPYETGFGLTSPVASYAPKEYSSGFKGLGEAAVEGLNIAGKAALNVPTSVARLTTGLADPRTYVNLGRAAAGGIQSIPGISNIYNKITEDSPKGRASLEESRAAFQGLVQGLHDSYGSVENIKRSITEDPAGTLLLVRGLLQGGGNITSKVGQEIKSPTVVKAGQALQKTGKAFAPIEDVAQGVKNIYKTKVQPKLEAKFVDDLANTYREVAGQKKTTTKVLDKSSARGYDDAQFLAERNITPNIEKGRIHTTGPEHSANLKKLDTQVAPLNEHFRMALKEIEPSVPKVKLADVRVDALRNVDRMSGLTETAKQALKGHINKEFDLLNRTYKGEVSLTELDSIKKANWASTPFDSTKPYQGEANYQIGKSAQKGIENSVPKDVFDVHELNREIGKYYSAKKFLTSLEGSVVKYGGLGRFANRIAGAVAGHSIGGPLGTIVGVFGGESITNILQSHTFSNPLKQRILKNLQVADPAAYTQAIDFIKKAGLERELRLALPAPKYIEGQQYKGGPSGIRSQAEAQQILENFGVKLNFEKPIATPLPKNILNLRPGGILDLKNLPRQGTPNAVKRLLKKL